MTAPRSNPRKPAAAKATADHLPKTEKPKVEKVDGGRRVTLRGISATVLDVALDDFELLDDLRAIDDGEAYRFPALLRRLVGADYDAVLEGLRDQTTGRVSSGDGIAWAREMLGALNPNS